MAPAEVAVNSKEEAGAAVAVAVPVPEQTTTMSKMVVYYENCPGCKVDQIKENQHGIPYKNLFFLGFVVLSAALPISSLFPFLYFMVRDFNIAKEEEDIGFYAGFLGASFMLGRALTSIPWGIIADRYGRKPVILFGTVSVVIFNTLFGLSTNFWMAISMRFLLGSLNGLLGPIKAYASEVCNEKHQALAVSLISTAWGIGLVVGPAIGGFLAQPADKYPNIFPRGSFFARFPYLLPCLCISAFALAVAIACYWIPETLHKHSGKTVEADGNNLNGDTQDPDQAESDTKENLFKNWPLMSAIIIYCVFSLHEIAYSEIFSLWALSPRKLGGLEFTTTDVGKVLSFSGLGLLLFQLFLYPTIQKIFGHVTVARVATFLSIPLLSSYPYIAKLYGLRLQLILNLASIIKNIFSLAILTGLVILQNNAVAQNQRGTAHGIATTGMSLFKTFGPAAGGVLFSWSQKRMHASFLPGSQLIFFALSMVLLTGLLMTFKPFLAFPRRDKLGK